MGSPGRLASIALRAVLRVIAVALVVALVPPTIGAHSTATSGTRATGYGLFEDLQYLTGDALNRRLDDYAALGVRWARFQLIWANVQAAGPDRYDWAPYDALIAGLRDRHIRPLAVVGTSPGWAQSPSCGQVTCMPTRPAAFAAFAKAAVQRYSRFGVKSWEIWNEPNSNVFWKPAPNVTAYTQLLKKSYAAIKSADPGATVITGGLAPAATRRDSLGRLTTVAPLSFLRGVYRNGGHGAFTAVGWHPYNYPRLPSAADPASAWFQMSRGTTSVRTIMRSHHDGTKKIWATEFGAHTDRQAAGGVTWQRQAKIVSQACTLWRKHDWAGPLFLYQLRDRGIDRADRENFFGLKTYAGVRKPAYRAFRESIREARNTWG